MVANGDFERDTISGTYQYMVPSLWSGVSVNVGGIGGDVLVMQGDYAWGGGNVPSGSNYLVLHNYNNVLGYVQQTLGLTLGLTYKLSFYARYRPFYPATSLTVSVDGNIVWGPTTLSSTWTLYSTTFTATSSSSVLKLVNTGITTGDVAVHVDTINVTPTGACITN